MPGESGRPRCGPPTSRRSTRERQKSSTSRSSSGRSTCGGTGRYDAASARGWRSGGGAGVGHGGPSSSWSHRRRDEVRRVQLRTPCPAVPPSLAGHLLADPLLGDPLGPPLPGLLRGPRGATRFFRRLGADVRHCRAAGLAPSPTRSWPCSGYWSRPRRAVATSLASPCGGVHGSGGRGELKGTGPAHILAPARVPRACPVTRQGSPSHGISDEEVLGQPRRCRGAQGREEVHAPKKAPGEEGCCEKAPRRRRPRRRPEEGAPPRRPRPRRPREEAPGREEDAGGEEGPATKTPPPRRRDEAPRRRPRRRRPGQDPAKTPATKTPTTKAAKKARRPKAPAEAAPASQLVVLAQEDPWSKAELKTVRTQLARRRQAPHRRARRGRGRPRRA